MLFCYVLFVLLCSLDLPHPAQMLLLGQRRTFFPLTLANVFSFGDMDRTLWRRLQCPSHLLSFCAQRRTLQRTQEKNPLGMELNKDLNAIQTKRPLLQRCSNSSSNALSWKFALGLQEFPTSQINLNQLVTSEYFRSTAVGCCNLCCPQCWSYRASFGLGTDPKKTENS